MATPTIEQITALAAALGLGGALAKAVDWWGRRNAADRREPAAMTRASAELMDSLSDGGKELLDEFRREFRYLRGRVAALQIEVDEGKADAAAARAAAAEARAAAEVAANEHARCKAEVEALKAQIDRMMAGPVAPFGAKPPRDA